MNTHIKILNQILAVEINNTLKGSYTMSMRDLTLGCKDGSTEPNQVSIVHHIIEWKINPMINSIDAEETFW